MNVCESSDKILSHKEISLAHALSVCGLSGADGNELLNKIFRVKFI